MFTLSNLKYGAGLLVIIICVSLAMDKPPQGGGLWQATKNMAYNAAGKIGLIETDLIKRLNALLNEYLANDIGKKPNQKTIDAIVSLVKQHPQLTQEAIRPNQSLLMILAGRAFYNPLTAQLINSNVRLNSGFKNNGGQNELMIAAYNGNMKILQYLLDRVVNVNLQDNEGNTALMLALGSIMFQTVQFITKEPDLLLNVVTLLLNAGADLTIANNEGKTAFDFAVNDGRALSLLNEFKKERIK